MCEPSSWTTAPELGDTTVMELGARDTGPDDAGWALSNRGVSTTRHTTTCFVLTHHPRAPLVCEGGTTFTFVPDNLGVGNSRRAHVKTAAAPSVTHLTFERA